MSKTALALALFIGWTLALLILMEAIRSFLVATKRVEANGFTPGNDNLSPFMQRLARAHLNCIEGLPVFGGLMLLAIATGNAAITDGLAPGLVGARVFQSTVHLLSLSAAAVTVRFVAFAVQMIIAAIWTWKLLAALG